MMLHKRYITLFIIVLVSSVIVAWASNTKEHPVSYWIWAGITSNEAPPNSELYAYQGLISNASKETIYQRIGIYPYPIKCKNLYLVYRLEGDLSPPSSVVAIFLKSVTQWQVHAVTPKGLQLDFDSPTSKLLMGLYQLTNLDTHQPIV